MISQRLVSNRANSSRVCVHREIDKVVRTIDIDADYHDHCVCIRLRCSARDESGVRRSPEQADQAQ
jgi:hypothetical protein